MFGGDIEPCKGNHGYVRVIDEDISPLAEATDKDFHEKEE